MLVALHFRVEFSGHLGMALGFFIPGFVPEVQFYSPTE